MKTITLELSGHNGTKLPAVLWQPEGKTKALLQITHGMTEHMGRYEAFARNMTSRGIAVAGFDLRGHGRNSGARAVYRAMQQAGLNVTFHLLPGARHMILGEQANGAADAAVKRILKWILEEHA